MKEYIHSEYTSRIVVEIGESSIGFVNQSEEIWWEKPYRLTSNNLPIFRTKYESKSTEFIILGDSKWSPKDFIDFLSNNQSLLNKAYGGLVFFDSLNKGTISTNFDLGETEEWSDILISLDTNKKFLHTFSATDLPIELTIENDIILQKLHWEALPNGIETSRQTSPKHIFRNKDKFKHEVGNSLNWWNKALEEAEKLNINRIEALTSISCNKRRQINQYK